MRSCSRRDFIRISSAAGASLWLNPWAHASRALQGPRPKVVVIGAGIAGVATAWLLNSECDVTLLEKNDYIGGHAHSVPVKLGDKTVPTDIGAQFVSPMTHPHYMALLEELDLYRPTRPGTDAMFSARMTLSFYPSPRHLPIFISPLFPGRVWPTLKSWNWKALCAFLKFHKHALRLEYGSAGSELTTEQWLARLPITRRERDSVFLPLLASMQGCSIAEVLDFSARPAIAFLARSFPRGILNPIVYWGAYPGLGGIADQLAQQCPGARIQKRATVQSVARSGAQYAVRVDGQWIEADHVVMACPPFIAREILGPGLPADILSKFEFFDAKIALHTDPIYMHQRKKYWSLYNTEVARESAEASIWYNRLIGEKHNLFRSSVMNRARPPENLLAEESFRHARVTPAFVAAQTELTALQGRGNLWFAGAYRSDAISHDTALLSAVEIARGIAPESPRLKALLGRFERG